MSGIFSQVNLLGSALKGVDANHRAVSQNIANVNTPGYKTQQVNYDELMRQLESRNAQDSVIDNVSTETVSGLAERVDGNNVDLEREVSELKKNALVFQTYSHLMASKLDTMRRAISG
ncbi:flagellar basal body rod protein FlgB [Stieleria varia]|uniref:Flagellar basal body rod protein FlgB n=1 Tax=Stieleria varia TaxID=2528005 RepID=A0A5C6ASC1_9BACT|nr:flagellar basal body rod protein FlgB [Stieleria varia]TWU02169.1 Flagellar basal body rod protein FlgB [Stieleria varia]